MAANLVEQILSEISLFHGSIQEIDGSTDCKIDGLKPTVTFEKYVADMSSKYFETPLHNSAGVFMYKTMLDAFIAAENNTLTEEELKQAIIKGCKEMGIKLNAKGGINGLNMDVHTVCVSLFKVGLLQPLTVHCAGAHALALEPPSNGQSKKITPEEIMLAFKQKWDESLSRYIKVIREIAHKQEVAKQKESESSQAVESVADSASVDTEETNAAASEAGESAVGTDNKPAGNKPEKGPSVDSLRRWKLSSSVTYFPINTKTLSIPQHLYVAKPSNPKHNASESTAVKVESNSSNGSTEVSMAFQPRECMQYVGKAVYMEQREMEIEHLLILRLLNQNGIDVNIEGLRPLEESKTITGYLLRTDCGPPEPMQLPQESHEEVVKDEKKEEIVPVCAPAVAAVEVPVPSVTTFSISPDLFKEAAVDGFAFTAQTLIEKAKKLKKEKDNRPADFDLLRKRYGDTVAAVAAFRSGLLTNHRKRKGPPPSSSSALTALNAPAAAMALKKRRHHVLAPMALELQPSQQISVMDQSLFAASSVSHSVASLSRCHSGDSVGSNGHASLSQWTQPAAVGNGVMIQLPELVITTTEIPWNLVAREFVTLDYTEEIGDYNAIVRRESSGAIGIPRCSSTGSLKSGMKSTPSLDPKGSPFIGSSFELIELPEEVDAAGVDGFLCSPSNGTTAHPLRRHASVVIAPNFKEVTGPMDMAVLSDNDSEEDIDDETMLKKHNDALARMREKFAEFKRLMTPTAESKGTNSGGGTATGGGRGRPSTTPRKVSTKGITLPAETPTVSSPQVPSPASVTTASSDTLAPVSPAPARKRGRPRRDSTISTTPNVTRDSTPVSTSKDRLVTRNQTTVTSEGHHLRDRSSLSRSAAGASIYLNIL